MGLVTLATMNAIVERSPWRLARLFSRWAAPAAQVPRLEQSAAQRARVDTSAWVTRAPIRFGLLTAGSGAGATAFGAWFASALPAAAQVAVSVGAACVGFVVPVAVLFAIEWVCAFPRQREEARDEVKRLTQSADIAQLAREFSDWVLAKRASLPRHGVRMFPILPDPESEAWLNHEKRADEIARLEARARAEDHERFRAAVVGVLGAEAGDPQHSEDLEELAEKLCAIADRQERAKLIAEAQGTQVGERHYHLLDSLLEAVQLGIANDRPVNYGDAHGGEQQNRDSFAAHFKSIMPALDSWHVAVESVEADAQGLRDWISTEVRRRGFAEPDYFDGTVAECLSEITLGRARRHELDEPLRIQLRCVEDVTTEDGQKHWSAYLHSGRAEIRVAELSNKVEEPSEKGMVDLNRVIAGMEKDLQTCFDAIQRSDAAAQVTAAQDALEALRQSLQDQLRRQRIVFNPVFSEGCSFCLAEIGLEPTSDGQLARAHRAKLTNRISRR